MLIDRYSVRVCIRTCVRVIHFLFNKQEIFQVEQNYFVENANWMDQAHARARERTLAHAYTGDGQRDCLLPSP